MFYASTFYIAFEEYVCFNMIPNIAWVDINQDIVIARCRNVGVSLQLSGVLCNTTLHTLMLCFTHLGIIWRELVNINSTPMLDQFASLCFYDCKIKSSR